MATMAFSIKSVWRRTFSFLPLMELDNSKCEVIGSGMIEFSASEKAVIYVEPGTRRKLASVVTEDDFPESWQWQGDLICGDFLLRIKRKWGDATWTVSHRGVTVFEGEWGSVLRPGPAGVGGIVVDDDKVREPLVVECPPDSADFALTLGALYIIYSSNQSTLI